MKKGQNPKMTLPFLYITVTFSILFKTFYPTIYLPDKTGLPQY